jgi:DNA helicase-2/ATP-dependent DNA helicase PcrA
MGLKSNITIQSNIYVNKTKSSYDKDFLRQVRGYDILIKIKDNLGTLHENPFTPSQLEEINNGSSACLFDKSGDKAFGSVIRNGESMFVCKCEYTLCPYYSTCSKEYNFIKIERKKQEETIHRKDQYRSITIFEDEEARDKDKNVKKPLLKSQSNIITFTEAKPFISDRRPVSGKDPFTLDNETILKDSQYDTVDQFHEGFSDDEEIENDEFVDKQGKQKEEAKQKSIIVTFLDKDKDKNEFIKETALYKRIQDPTEIIKSEISDRIIVNAGPGTGKTYSVINRLGYIIRNNLLDLQEKDILVLCYSRSAVAVIKKRIEEEISAGKLPVESRQLYNGIRTFDSFVSYLLYDENEASDLQRFDYDQRIKLFIDRMDEYNFDSIGYLIVDEMQDLVGVRARLVQGILERINCGFLLLGDRCQSIYDYLIEDENDLNSYRFYNRLESLCDDSVKRFELTSNYRQSDDLAMITEDLRKAMLSNDTEEQKDMLKLCVDILKEENRLGDIRKNIEKIRDVLNPSTAILCRSNAEVLHICSELYNNDICSHRILKRAQQIDLVPWIAEILSTYTENRIGYSTFIHLSKQAGYEDGDDKWNLLKSTVKDPNGLTLDIKELVNQLVSISDLPPELDLGNQDSPTISTIHRAKGKEFDHVILLENDFNIFDKTEDEIKIAYVALTRAKKRISFINAPYIKQRKDRWKEYKRNPYTNKYILKKIEVGCDGDILPYGFAHKDRNPVETQAYIANRVKKGDMIEAYKKEDMYELLHNGNYVGMLSKSFVTELKKAIWNTAIPALPAMLSNLYVNNIITIANKKFDEMTGEPYSKSGLWLGLDIAGIADILRF